MSGINLNKMMEFWMKDPVRTMAFAMLLIIGILYLDGRSNRTDQIDALKVRVTKLEASDSLKTVMLLDCAKGNK